MSVELLEREEDRPAYVQFEKEAVPDPEASLKAGHHVSKDRDMILVSQPGTRDQVRREANKWLAIKEQDVKNGRVPARHLEIWKKAYEHWKAGEEVPLNGTSIKEWNALSPAQCTNLKNAGCKTIEDVASLNDEGMRRVGIGAVDLKNKAKAWLQAAKDHGPLIYQVSTLQKENEQLRGAVKSLQDQIERMAKGEKPAVIAPEPVIAHEETIIEMSPAERYEAKFGKKPHWKMKEETILQRLQE